MEEREGGEGTGLLEELAFENTMEEELSNSNQKKVERVDANVIKAWLKVEELVTLNDIMESSGRKLTNRLE